MDTLRTGRTEDAARGENEPLAAKPGEKSGLDAYPGLGSLRTWRRRRATPA